MTLLPVVTPAWNSDPSATANSICFSYTHRESTPSNFMYCPARSTTSPTLKRIALACHTDSDTEELYGNPWRTIIGYVTDDGLRELRVNAWIADSYVYKEPRAHLFVEESLTDKFSLHTTAFHLNKPLQQIRHRLGTCIIVCPHRDALHWIEERSQKGTRQIPKFSTCCMNGAI